MGTIYMYLTPRELSFKIMALSKTDRATVMDFRVQIERLNPEEWAKYFTFRFYLDSNKFFTMLNSVKRQVFNFQRYLRVQIGIKKNQSNLIRLKDVIEALPKKVKESGLLSMDLAPQSAEAQAFLHKLFKANRNLILSHYSYSAY